MSEYPIFVLFHDCFEFFSQSLKFAFYEVETTCRSKSTCTDQTLINKRKLLQFETQHSNIYFHVNLDIHLHLILRCFVSLHLNKFIDIHSN